MNTVRLIGEAIAEHIVTRDFIESFFKAVAYCGLSLVMFKSIGSYSPGLVSALMFGTFLAFATLTLIYSALHVSYPLASHIEEFMHLNHRGTINPKLLRLLCTSVYMTLSMSFAVGIYHLVLFNMIGS